MSELRAPPSAPPAAPPGGASLPGQPPFGASPVTMPTPNRGNEAASVALVRNAMDLLTKALAGLGPGGAASEVGTAVRKATDILAKVPQLAPGATTPGAQNAGMEQFMQERRQQAPVLAQLAAMRGGQGGAAPSGGPAATPG